MDFYPWRQPFLCDLGCFYDEFLVKCILRYCLEKELEMSENTVPKQQINSAGVTGYQLKLIALITMLIDHIAAVVIWRVYEASLQITASQQASDFFGDKLIVWVAANQELVYNIYEIMRCIGRMSFPIYCFLLVEGFLHTRNVPKYALRLLAFAFISEIPFDLAIEGKWFNWDYNNVFFTLVIGLVLIWGLSYIEKFYEFWKEKQWDDFLGKMITVVAGVFLAVALGGFAEMVLKTDYGIAGVLAIAVIYLFRHTKELGFGLAVLLLSVLSSSIEILALIMLVPLYRYDGTRGKNIKYVFYAFYPVHLMILALICIALGV